MARRTRANKWQSQTVTYVRGSGWMQLTRDGDRVWLNADGKIEFTAKQCRMLAAWLIERAHEMEATLDGGKHE